MSVCWQCYKIAKYFSYIFPFLLIFLPLQYSIPEHHTECKYHCKKQVLIETSSISIYKNKNSTFTFLGDN